MKNLQYNPAAALRMAFYSILWMIMALGMTLALLRDIETGKQMVMLTGLLLASLLWASEAYLNHRLAKRNG